MWYKRLSEAKTKSCIKTQHASRQKSDLVFASRHNSDVSLGNNSSSSGSGSNSVLGAHRNALYMETSAQLCDERIKRRISATSVDGGR